MGICQYKVRNGGKNIIFLGPVWIFFLKIILKLFLHITWQIFTSVVATLRWWLCRTNYIDYGTRPTKLSFSVISCVWWCRYSRSAIHTSHYAIWSNNNAWHEHVGWINTIKYVWVYGTIISICISFKSMLSAMFDFRKTYNTVLHRRWTFDNNKSA